VRLRARRAIFGAMAMVIGLTGGIASGKSTVSRLLGALGATVIDADAIVHELQAPGMPMLEEIAARFGPQLLDADGRLDRRALGAIVFGDRAARAQLEAIVHPQVRAVIAERVAAAQAAGAALIVVDIPLLFERGEIPAQPSTQEFDATVLVYARDAQQIERLIARDHCSREDAERRVRAQLPIEDKKAMADVVIDNSGALDETKRQVEQLFERFSEARA
jgi:dephospho-CoA kinase